jgi:hypothetical protein
MRLSVALITAASIIALAQIASAAEQNGQGCDLRGVKGSGCEPPGGPTGKGKMQPTEQKQPLKNGVINNGGTDKPPPPPPQ